jgi:hypothetical protein
VHGILDFSGAIPSLLLHASFSLLGEMPSLVSLLFLAREGFLIEYASLPARGRGVLTSFPLKGRALAVAR